MTRNEFDVAGVDGVGCRMNGDDGERWIDGSMGVHDPMGPMPFAASVCGGCMYLLYAARIL